MKLKKIGVLSAAVLLMSQMCWQPVKQQETFAASDVSVMTAVDSTYELLSKNLKAFHVSAAGTTHSGLSAMAQNVLSIIRQTVRTSFRRADIPSLRMKQR